MMLAMLALAAACVRHATVSQDFGLPGGITSPPTTQKTGADSTETNRQGTPLPGGSLQTILHQQIQGAYDPFKDDPRIPMLQNQLKLNPQNVDARLELAGVFEGYRLFDGGMEHYSEVLRLILSTPESSGSQAEKAIMGLGRCAQAAGRAREAIPLMETSTQDWPGPNSWDALGLLYDELGDHAAGERAFREAVVLDGKSSRLHNNLGYNLLLQNRTEAAESEFRSALELNPQSATTRNNLGVVLARRGDLQGAMEQFLQTPDVATAHNNLAVVLLETGQYERSREELFKALAMHPYFSPALTNFKLVQERICESVGTAKCGSRPALENGVRSVETPQNDGRRGAPASVDRSPN